MQKKFLSFFTLCHAFVQKYFFTNPGLVKKYEMSVEIQKYAYDIDNFLTRFFFMWSKI